MSTDPEKNLKMLAFEYWYKYPYFCDFLLIVISESMLIADFDFYVRRKTCFFPELNRFVYLEIFEE